MTCRSARSRPASVAINLASCILPLPVWVIKTNSGSHRCTNAELLYLNQVLGFCRSLKLSSPPAVPAGVSRPYVLAFPSRTCWRFPAVRAGVSQPFALSLSKHERRHQRARIPSQSCASYRPSTGSGRTGLVPRPHGISVLRHGNECPGRTEWVLREMAIGTPAKRHERSGAGRIPCIVTAANANSRHSLLVLGTEKMSTPIKLTSLAACAG